MKIDILANNHRRVTLEHHPDIEIHDRDIALDALGTLVAKHHNSSEKHLVPARLAVTLATLNTRDQDDAGTPIRIPATTRLIRADALTLRNALANYTQDTGAAISQIFYAGNPHGASMRAVGAEIANSMLLDLTNAFSLDPATEPLRLGFR